MWWRYVLAGALLTIPVFLYFGMKWLSEAVPLPIFMAFGAALFWGIYKIGCWMDRQGWEP